MDKLRSCSNVEKAKGKERGEMRIHTIVVCELDEKTKVCRSDLRQSRACIGPMAMAPLTSGNPTLVFYHPPRLRITYSKVRITN